MIEYVQGDAFSNENLGMWDAIGHQVNARGGFGSGFAAAVTRFSPGARDAYKRAHEKHGWKLGQVLPFQDETTGKWIVHICGQDRYGSGGPHTDYDALGAGLRKFAGWTEKQNLRPALPLIGCGLAGGEWRRVEKLVKQAFGERHVLVFYLKKKDLD